MSSEGGGRRCGAASRSFDVREVPARVGRGAGTALLGAAGGTRRGKLFEVLGVGGEGLISHLRYNCRIPRILRALQIYVTVNLGVIAY